MDLTAVLQAWWGPGRPDLMGGCHVTGAWAPLPTRPCGRLSPHPLHPCPCGRLSTPTPAPADASGRCFSSPAARGGGGGQHQDICSLFPQDPRLGKGEL